MTMGSSSAAQEDVLLSHLGGSDTIHYNPSDLSTWLESMICEAELSLPQQQQSSNNHNPYIPPAKHGVPKFYGLIVGTIKQPKFMSYKTQSSRQRNVILRATF
ncbi:hypothetical protein IFM89_022706 [Coptis chinensis]|uniref:Transcriptional factor DELLA N-terminal domain-containing protein n=1 Tax=Coptis chinensis TaxID=261450 RepID=A0A835LSE9_9MAGN|nr:hypothetical protein IFM89_022706 [Coptis chinensis]